MNFKMKKIATAVAAGLGASVVGMSVSHSQDEILFPYVVNSATVTTVVSVVNIQIGTSLSSADLHYTYWFKSGANATLANSQCQELNVFRSTSPNDIQTFDVGDSFAQDNFGVLFNDPSINNNYQAQNQSFSTLRNVGTPVRAFLIVDNKGGGPTNVPASQGSLYGEAVILDFGTGAAWGYRAYNALTEEALVADGQASGSNNSKETFSNQFETEGEVLRGLTPVHLFPDDEFSVRFFVTPISPSVDSTAAANLGRLVPAELGDQSQGDITATVSLVIPDGSNGVVFDRDENPISGQINQTVVCVAGIDVNPTLLSAGVLAELKQAGSDGGGWSYFRTVPLVDNLATTANEGRDIDSTDEVVAFRLDFNRNNTFNGQTVFDPNSKFNSAVWLRNGTDRFPAYEDLVPVYTYDVPQPAAPTTWGPAGIPSPYHQ